jgi:hypothetical protein
MLVAARTPRPIMRQKIRSRVGRESGLNVRHDCFAAVNLLGRNCILRATGAG